MHWVYYRNKKFHDVKQNYISALALVWLGSVTVMCQSGD